MYIVMLLETNILLQTTKIWERCTSSRSRFSRFNCSNKIISFVVEQHMYKHFKIFLKLTLHLVRNVLFFDALLKLIKQSVNQIFSLLNLIDSLKSKF